SVYCTTSLLYVVFFLFTSTCLRSSVLFVPPAFPTRRSSDLTRGSSVEENRIPKAGGPCRVFAPEPARAFGGVHASRDFRPQVGRSEEHTSELQSRFDLVCRLLLEKKKRRTITHNNMRDTQRS